jgi:hypothetical protein
MHGMENAKLVMVSVAQSMALTYKIMTVSDSFWIILSRHTKCGAGEGWKRSVGLIM